MEILKEKHFSEALGLRIKPFPLAQISPRGVFWYGQTCLSSRRYLRDRGYILLTRPQWERPLSPQLPFEIPKTKHLWQNKPDKVYTITVTPQHGLKPNSHPDWTELMAGSAILCPASITLCCERCIAAPIVIGCVSTLMPATYCYGDISYRDTLEHQHGLCLHSLRRADFWAEVSD